MLAVIGPYAAAWETSALAEAEAPKAIDGPE